MMAVKLYGTKKNPAKSKFTAGVEYGTGVGYHRIGLGLGFWFITFTWDKKLKEQK